jgi:hypothetical protein
MLLGNVVYWISYVVPIFNNNYTLIIVACMHMWICRESKETKSVYNSHEDQIERSMAAETQLM